MIKNILYYFATKVLRDILNIRLSPRQQYSQEYLLSPRWMALRYLRRTLDGWQCQRCGRMKSLQTHHTTYKFRGAPGLSGFVAELFSLKTLCNRCHALEPRNPD